MNEERLEDLVAEFVERREEGERLDPADFAAEHPSTPGLLEELRAALAAEALLPAGIAVDRPERIGPWRVEGELGRGGGGRVFRVTRGGAPECALKLLNLAAVGNPRALERFQREGKILTGLDHPGIVRVHEVSGEGDLPYIVMDLLPGQTLSARLAEARRELGTSRAERTPPTDLLSLPGDGDTIARAASLVARLARAVQHAHERGLLHRDLKPSNVLLDADGEPVLVDFGLAVSEESATLTESGDLLGTPHYMAPEQARGERADARADVYGLAAVLYELLTLRPPHEGRDPLEVLQRIRTRPHVPVRRLNPSVPAPLARVVDRALAWRRARRTASAAELAADLEAAVAGTPVRARRRGALERAEDLVRFQPGAVTGAALLALALIVVVLLATRGGGGPDLAARIDAIDRAAQVAWLELDEDALGEAAEDLRSLDPEHPRVALYATEARREPARPAGDPAVDALVEGLAAEDADRLQEAVAAYARARRAAPEWVLPVALAALVDAGEPDRPRRLADLEVAARLLPESTRLARKHADELRHRGRAAEGARLLGAHLARGGGDWRAWSELAACRKTSGDAAGAYEAIEQALQRAGEEPHPSVLQRQGAILDDLGQSADAEQLFRDLVRRFPRDGQLRFNLARVLDGECRLAEASEVYRQAYERDPMDLKAVVSLAHLHAGSGLFNEPPCERCVRVFEQNPGLQDPDETLNWVRRGVAIDGCESEWVPQWAVSTALKAGCAREVRDLLAGQIDEQAEVDERVVRIERAVRALDRALAKENGE